MFTWCPDTPFCLDTNIKHVGPSSLLFLSACLTPYVSVIPYKNIFRINPPKPEHVYLQARVTQIDPHRLTLSRAFPEHGFPTPIIPFDYVVYALGSRLPQPLDLWASPASGQDNHIVSSQTSYNGTKAEGRQWLKEKQKVIEKAPTVLVVGGGALGIRMSNFSAFVT